RVFVHDQGLQELAHHLQELGIEDHLLEGGDEPSLHPTGAMQEPVGVPHDGTPDRHFRFVRGLRIDGVGGTGVARAVGEAVAARTYAGVPNAGARVFMSTLEVKPPYIQGARGATIWMKARPASASAFCCASAPAMVAGDIAPESVNGVITTACPARAISMSPC